MPLTPCKKIILILNVVSIACVSVVTAADDTYETLRSKIVRFDTVDTNLYRGSQPAWEDFALLKKLGVKKVINFREEPQWIEKERAVVEGLGMEYISMPWIIYKPYQKNLFDQFFAAIKDKDTAPVFFHCKRGADRTGVIAACYKMKHEGISASEAYRYTTRYKTRIAWRPFIKKKLAHFARSLKTTRLPN